MKNYATLILLTFLLFCSYQINSQNITDTRLMRDPAVSMDKIAFIYAEDLWIAAKDGSNPRRLTIDEGIESNPVFSPDGTMIAFSAQYDGNIDVFIIPSTGGVPERLTWHPSRDVVQDFTPDGNNVLFTSSRSTYTGRHAKLYTISTTGGQPTELPIPTAFSASYSADGQYIAYTPLYEVFNQWKHYRGGTQSRIWIYNTASHEVSEIPKLAAGSNDTNPQWIGDSVYFRSDRNGEFNLYAYDVASKKVSTQTNYGDFPILNLTTSGNDLIYEQAGYLHLFDHSASSSTKLTIGIATDLLEMRSRFVSESSYIRSASISPSGARVAFDYRGEIVTVPAKKGDVANITQSVGSHEQQPQWSPDGKSIAYFSDASGEYDLKIKQFKNGAVKSIPISGTGFYAFLHWSPNSKKLCFVDNGRNLYVVDVLSGKLTKIDTDKLYVPGRFRELFGSWSSDSKWVSYTVITETNFEQAYVYSVDKNKSFALSDGLSNVSEPIFDPSGKYIYMLSSTDAGPVVNWFDQSNQDMEMSNSIFLVTLQKELISPLAKENDEEKGEEEKEEKEKKDKDDKEENGDPDPVIIDWDNINNRIIDLPIAPGMHYNLSSSEEGKLFYLSRKPHSSFNDSRSLRLYDLKERKDEEVMQANWFEIAAGGKKMLYRNKQTWGVTDTGKKPENGNLNTAVIEVKIDPVKEWKNIFNEAWRVNRDYFYDPGMHGVDWNAMKEKYSVFLTDVSCRNDLYRVMQWMFSELSVGHHRFSSRGDRLNNPKRVSGGLLGADYEIANNRYKISKIFGGLNWTPELRSPLTEPGVNVQVGEYLLAVNGKQLTANQNFYSLFENTANKIVELTVGPNANGSDSRKVKAVPIFNERALRNRDWVEGNMKKVHAATNGQVAYVYVPNTAGAGHQYFKRYFFPQANKKAIIIDERHNGGGQLADYYIDMLKKPYQSHWNFRYGNDMKAPSASIQGPKVMLIDETAGSGGDYLPWMFRKFELGTLIGKRTWGGLVGILGYPEFIDGGSVTAPNLAFWNEDGFGIENVGIAPDIEIEQWPKEVIAGHDPQLEKAIEVVLEQLKNNPPSYPKRPEYPVKTKKSN
ncbi:MAG: peptidase S41 [Flavobacteriaceae bacterium]|nr:MAG: peptidase S41 [Flavobacteriaceae bacterium]